jgi:hypothetical protein
VPQPSSRRGVQSPARLADAGITGVDCEDPVVICSRFLPFDEAHNFGRYFSSLDLTPS